MQEELSPRVQPGHLRNVGTGGARTAPRRECPQPVRVVGLVGFGLSVLQNP